MGFTCFFYDSNVIGLVVKGLIRSESILNLPLCAEFLGINPPPASMKLCFPAPPLSILEQHARPMSSLCEHARMTRTDYMGKIYRAHGLPSEEELVGVFFERLFMINAPNASTCRLDHVQI